MRTTEISYSYSRRVQLKQFEPMEIGITETVQIDEGEDREAARMYLRSKVISDVEKDIAFMKGQVK